MFQMRQQHRVCFLKILQPQNPCTCRCVSKLSAINRGLRRSSPSYLSKVSSRQWREEGTEVDQEHGRFGSYKSNGPILAKRADVALDQIRADPHGDGFFREDLKEERKERGRQARAARKEIKEEKAPEEALSNLSVRQRAFEAEAEKFGEVKFSTNRLKKIIRDLNKIMEGIRRHKEPRQDMVDGAEVAIKALNAAATYWGGKREDNNGTRYLYVNVVRPRMKKTIYEGWPSDTAGKLAWVVVPDVQRDEGFNLFIPGRPTGRSATTREDYGLEKLSNTPFNGKPYFPKPSPYTTRSDIPSQHDNVGNHETVDLVSSGELQSPSHTLNRRTPNGSSQISKKQSSTSTHIAAGVEQAGHPVAIPYASAASVFLYGYNTVIAALKARRRRLYQLHLHSRVTRRDGVDIKHVLYLASAAGVQIHENQQLDLMNNMSEGRPHNGIILEASRLPAPPVLSLGRPDAISGVIPLGLERQSAEDHAVNGAPESIPFDTRTWRQPFVIMLDGITDPANIGSIIRSAHFYGVDAIAIGTNTCANLASPTLAKASSGACEAMQIFALSKPSNFVYESAKAGWRIYAAVAPPPTATSNPVASLQPLRDFIRYTTTTQVSQSSPLATNPVILLLGAEGEGLRDNLKRRADSFISIPLRKRTNDYLDVGVDSMNVGVAAGVLMESFLQDPTVMGGNTAKEENNHQD